MSDAGTGTRRFLPASVLALRGYTPRLFATDLIAGITVGLVALPLAMAFAISSGMTPQSGIYCAIVTGLIISALGGSTVQIGGPTGAFVVVVSGIIATYGVDGLFMCTMMAGVVLVVMGLTGTGTAVRFIPRPVVTGFTGGIAVTIASTQLQDFFGITLPGVVPFRRVAQPGLCRLHRVRRCEEPADGSSECTRCSIAQRRDRVGRTSGLPRRCAARRSAVGHPRFQRYAAPSPPRAGSGQRLPCRRRPW